MAGKTVKRTSLSQIYKGMILIMIPVLMVGTVVSVSLGRSIQRQAMEVLRDNMDSQVEKLMDTFNNINYCLMDNLNNNNNLKLIQKGNSLEKNKAIIDLKSDFSSFRYYFGTDYHFFSYDMVQTNIYSETPENMKYKKYDNIQKAIKLYMSNSDKAEFLTANRRWNLVNTEDGTQILIKVYKNKGITIGCWVLLDIVEEMFRVNGYSRDNNFLFLVKDGQVLTRQDLYKKVSKGDSVDYYKGLSGRTVNGTNVYYYNFYKGSFSLLSIIDTMGNYMNNLQILYAFILLLFIFIGVGIFLLYYIRKRLILPIRTFMDHLQNFDEYEERERDFRFAELKEADELFQKAKQQIKELKIAVYEKELQKRKLEQDYFQVQIKPHFYLNCLNIIYNMAQTKRFEEIQKLSMEVSRYMRTLFRSGMDLVCVREEMEHLKGYLNIQEFRYSSNFTYEVHVEEAILDYRMLPLIVHTMVENSIKHTIMKKDIIHIDISVRQEFILGDEFIKIVVWDTGDGFSEEVLASLKSGEKLTTKEGGRIGLSNMLARLEYVYKKRARVQFCNRPEGGAKVEVFLPVCPALEEMV